MSPTARSSNNEGGGIYHRGMIDTVTLKSSIVAMNTALGAKDVQGIFSSGGFNLIGDAGNSTFFFEPTDQRGHHRRAAGSQTRSEWSAEQRRVDANYRPTLRQPGR